MCRVCMFNKEGMNIIENTYGLKNYFDFLERSQGGHGNGVALIKGGKCTLLKKGLRLNNATIDKLIKANDWDWAIYHTRIASIGNKKTRNCHPFKSKNNILAMNGTETDFEFIADIQDITDTEAILRFATLENQNLIDVTSQLDSVFMGLCDGEVFVTAGSSASYKLSIVQANDGIVFASEFPSGFNEMKPEDFPFCWIEGDKLYLRKPRKTDELYKGYGYWWNEEEDKLYDDKLHGWERYFNKEDLDEINNQSKKDCLNKESETKPIKTTK